jgi:hypothetical protein
MNLLQTMSAVLMQKIASLRFALGPLAAKE